MIPECTYKHPAILSQKIIPAAANRTNGLTDEVSSTWQANLQRRPVVVKAHQPPGSAKMYVTHVNLMLLMRGGTIEVSVSYILEIPKKGGYAILKIIFLFLVILRDFFELSDLSKLQMSQL